MVMSNGPPDFDDLQLRRHPAEAGLKSYRRTDRGQVQGAVILRRRNLYQPALSLPTPPGSGVAETILPLKPISP